MAWDDDEPAHIPGGRWGDPINDADKGALDTILRAWEAEREHGVRRGPFDGLALTGSAVFWLAARAFARPGGGAVGVAEQEALLRAVGANRAGALELLDAFALHRETTLHLEGAILTDAHLEGAILIGARLEGTILYRAHLEGADLREASVDRTTDLNGAHFDRAVLDRASFDSANLAAVDWGEVCRLGDELDADCIARGPLPDPRPAPGGCKGAYRGAARAYRSLALALRTQGLATDATRFHYRAQVMERKALYWTLRAMVSAHRIGAATTTGGQWLASLALGTCAGYGDYLGRLFLTYALVVCGFAALFFTLDGQSLSWAHAVDMLTLSLTAFHERGIPPPHVAVTEGMAWLAVGEAVLGLLIEVLLVAAFVRRVTGE